MKLVSIIIASILFCIPAFGQKDQPNKTERLENLKIAYITKEINLTSEESQQFWPIYNDYQNQLKQLRKDMKRNKKGEEISEAEADQILLDRLNMQQRKLDLERATMDKLIPVVGARRVLKLIAAESSFKKRVLQKAGRGRDGKKRKDKHKRK